MHIEATLVPKAEKCRVEPPPKTKTGDPKSATEIQVGLDVGGVGASLLVIATLKTFEKNLCWMLAFLGCESNLCFHTKHLHEMK